MEGNRRDALLRLDEEVLQVEEDALVHLGSGLGLGLGLGLGFGLGLGVGVGLGCRKWQQ